MGLDIRIIKRRPVKCPHCNEVVCYEDIDYASSGGRTWYEFLEPIGYYVPYEQRTEENDWYGKDMVLTKEQSIKMRNFVGCYNVYDANAIANLIAGALIDGDEVVINADW